MKSLLSITGILGILVVAFSISYYFLLIRPSIEKERLDIERDAQEAAQKANEQEIEEYNNALYMTFENECKEMAQDAGDTIALAMNQCTTDECLEYVVNEDPRYDELRSYLAPGYIDQCVEEKMNALSSN